MRWEADVQGWILLDNGFPSRGTQRPIAEGNVDQPYPSFQFGEGGRFAVSRGLGGCYVLWILRGEWGEVDVASVGECLADIDAGRYEENVCGLLEWC